MKNITFHFSKPEESNGYLLWQISMLWQRKIKHELDKYNITHTQFVLLAALGWLAREQEIVTQMDLANHTKTDRMMVSKVLRTLQEKKFILRMEHKTDTRAKSIILTEEGQEVLQKTIQIVENTDNLFFSVLEGQAGSFNENMKLLFFKNE